MKTYNFTLLLSFYGKTVKVNTKANGIDEDDAKYNMLANFRDIVRPDTEFDIISYELI